jgi:hypothetical protein
MILETWGDGDGPGLPTGNVLDFQSEVFGSNLSQDTPYLERDLSWRMVSSGMLRRGACKFLRNVGSYKSHTA